MSHCTGIDRTLTRTRYSSSLGEPPLRVRQGFHSKCLDTTIPYIMRPSLFCDQGIYNLWLNQ